MVGAARVVIGELGFADAGQEDLDLHAFLFEQAFLLRYEPVQAEDRLGAFHVYLDQFSHGFALLSSHGDVSLSGTGMRAGASVAPALFLTTGTGGGQGRVPRRGRDATFPSRALI